MNAHLLDRLLDMHVWQNVEIVFGALGAVLLVLGILWRKVLIPMRKALALLRDIGDQLLGDDDPPGIRRRPCRTGSTPCTPPSTGRDSS